CRDAHTRLAHDAAPAATPPTAPAPRSHPAWACRNGPAGHPAERQATVRINRTSCTGHPDPQFRLPCRLGSSFVPRRLMDAERITAISASDQARSRSPAESTRTAARRALFTVFAVSPAGGGEGRNASPPPTAIPKANAGQHKATPSYARRLSSLVKCPLSDTEPRPATPGR